MGGAMVSHDAGLLQRLHGACRMKRRGEEFNLGRILLFCHRSIPTANLDNPTHCEYNGDVFSFLFSVWW